MVDKSTDNRGWLVEGAVGVDLEKLVELYKSSARAGNEERALIVTAEALAAESTALSNPAAEASAFVAANAVRSLYKGK